MREDGSGLGDYRNYGIRTMEVSADGNTLFCGMASYANLGSDAGWELRELIYAAPTTTLDAPFITPEGGTFSGFHHGFALRHVIGASIYYTLDGSEPSQTSKPYISPIVLTGTTTVKARAYLGGYLPSASANATFTKIDPPQFDFSFTNEGDKSVVKGSSVQNAINTALVSGDTQTVSFSVSGLPEGLTSAFSAEACAPACSTTLTMSASAATPAGTYGITVTGTAGALVKNTSFNLTVSEPLKVDTPVISPDGGTFIDPIEVSITSATGASIYFTLDGSEPTEASTLYSSPFVLSDTTMVKARAFLSGYLPSNTATAAFTKTVPPQLDTPVINPSGGTFFDSATVSISAAEGVSVRYTLDESEPMETSMLYESPIVLAETATVKARAYLAGYLPSNIATATFMKTVATQFDFSLSSEGDKAVVKGNAVQNTIDIGLVSGDTQAVAFSIGGLPDGASSLFSLDSCSPACTTSLTINTSTATPAGQYPITVTGTAGGLVKITDFYLEVLEQP